MSTELYSLLAIPYTVRITTGSERDMGTETNAWIKISGRKKKLHTGKVYLDAVKAKKFRPGSVESFALEAVDIEDVREIEVRNHYFFFLF